MLVIQDLSTVGFKGRLMAERKRAGKRTFEKLWERPIKNKIPTAGLAYMAYLLSSDTPTKAKYGGIGTGTTAATDSDTGCETQILTRAVGTLSRITTSHTNDTYKIISSFTSDTTSYAVTEYITAESSSGEPLLNRVVFAAITLNLNDVLQFTYTCQMTEV